MASNTYNMNTWGAKRILGDTSVASITEALLQITANNSWILSSGRQSTYGIKYVYDSSTDHDKIELYGGYQVSSANAPTAWVQLDTGDVYILGQVGINHAPDTYQLYVDGTSYYTDTLTIDNGAIDGKAIEIIGANNKTFSFKLSGSATNVDIGWDWTAIEGAGAAFRSSDFTNQEGNFVIYARKKDSNDAAVYTMLTGTSGETTNSGILSWGGSFSVGSREVTTGPSSLTYSNRITIVPYFHTDGPWYIKSGDDSSNAYLALYYSSTQLMRIKHDGTQMIDWKGNASTASKWATARTLTIGATGKSVDGSANVSWSMNEIMGSSDSTKFYRGDKTWSNTLNGAFTANGTITANGGYLKATLNNNTVTIGSANTSWCHIENSANISFYFNKAVHVNGAIYVYNTTHHLDSTAIWAYRWRTTNLELAELDANRMGLCNHGQAAARGLNVGSLLVSSAWADASKVPTNGIWCRGNIVVNGANTTGGGLVLSDDGDFVDLNDGYGSLRFSYGVRVFSAKSGGSAVITLSNSGGITANHGHNFMVGGNEVNFIPDSYNNTFWINYTTFSRNNSGTVSNYYFGNGKAAWNTTHIYAGAVHNAVWNDFAEFRESNISEPGRTLISNGTGQMILCQERLAPGAKIISDTYGCSVGESDLAKTPLGVAGRVLAYPYQDRNNYKPGDAVCAAPNGTIDIMTREEIMMYPDRIIGIVDEVPVYEQWEQWHTCYKDETKDSEFSRNKVADVQVKGRIWIYVR